MLKISIDLPSLFQKGITNTKDDFLVALINGYQGSGKSYYGIYNLERNFKGRVVYTCLLYTSDAADDSVLV